MEAFQAIAEYSARPGLADEVAGLLTTLAEASRAEPRNLAYTVHRDLEDSHRFVVVERYTSDAGFDEHQKSPHFTKIAVERIRPLLLTRTVITSFVQVVA